ncbi:hypothetical protein ACFRAQ_26435 [Nocardia sp. NPDC056611]|uniref:hypothetical protein n=1 Tax=unclassified Nocardia TaxID=2637762 RepID=UPI00366F536F
MTQKKAIGLLVSAFVCAAVFTMNPSAAWGSGDVGTPGSAPGAVAPNVPAGNGPAAVAPERIVPAPPPAGAFLCPTP